MSGIEVAGIILGAIPVLVEAFKQYDTIRKTYDSSKKKARARHLRCLASSLKYNHVIVKLNINQLLDDAGAAERPTECLELDQVLKLLAEQKVAKPVQRYLGIAYGQYIDTLVECQDILRDIATAFEGLLPDSEELLKTNTSKSGPPIWSFGGKRLRFLMEREAIDEKMALLKEYTSRLDKLHSSGDAIDVLPDPGPSPQTIKKLTHFLSNVQAHACNLYSGITDHIPPSSGCHHQHSVRLFLEPRVDFLLRPKMRKCPVSFDIELAGFKPVGVADTWHRGDVALVDVEEDVSCAVESTQSAMPNVRFHVPMPCLEPSSVANTKAKLEPLDRLCRVINEAHKSGCTVRLHMSKTGVLSYSKKQTKCMSELRPIENKHVRLTEVLEKVRENGPERRWSLNQRMHLAFKVASSVLQLNRTPWLTESCTADSIYFLETGIKSLSLNPASRPALPFDANRPFLTRVGAPGFSIDQYGDPMAQSWMLDFAILLLEIWEKKTFKQWAKERKEMAKGPHVHRLDLAQRWWADIHQDISDYYKFALARCLEGASLSTHSWEDGNFPQRFCADVVVPLWENCKDLKV